MPSAFCQAFSAALLLGAIASGDGAYASGTVTIFRCVDAKGNVALQDMACPRDTHQEVRQMLRPQDAGPQPERPSEAPPPLQQQVVRQLRNSRPLYQCQTADGQTYTSQTPNPPGHYVPVWTTIPAGSGRNSRPYVFPGTTYVQDTCMRMAQDAGCQRLHDRDDELDTLIFNAQPDDRARYEREQSTVQSELRNDCGA
jgi:hypothetical protein